MDGPSQINPQKANCTFKSSKHNPFDRKMNQVNNISHLDRPKGIKSKLLCMCFAHVPNRSFSFYVSMSKICLVYDLYERFVLFRC